MCGRKAVLVYDGDTLVGRFSSMRALSRFLNCNYSHLTADIKEGKTIKGHTIVYEKGGT
jgi:hypothetical protein